MLAIVAVVVVVGLGGLVAVVLVASDGDPGMQAPVVGAEDAALTPYEHTGGDYQLSVPAGWAATEIEGDISDIGATTFPDDPRLAARFQQMTDILPRAIVFMGLDVAALDDPFVANLNIVRVPTPGFDGTDLDRLGAEARLGIDVNGGSVTHEGRFLTAAGEAVRLEYDAEYMEGVSGVQYTVPVEGEVWSLTFASPDMATDEALADAVAATFAPGGAA